MKISILVLSGCAIALGYSTACVADSLLFPTDFPKTFEDIDFTTRMKIKAADYDRYSQLTPYEHLILDTADADMAEQIDQDLAENQSSNSYYNPTINNPLSGQYCAVRHPGIPAGQTIPFGSPVLHEHFIFCSPYAMLDRGRGPRIHSGYDIGCTLESFDRPIFTPADGVVSLVKPNRAGGSAGNYVIVDHGNGFKTWYLHLNQIFVTQGQRVSAGCKIATIGNTGASLETKNPNNQDPRFSKNISHLHYEIHYTGTETSVTTSTGKTVAITHGFPNANSQNIKNSIDPTQFICVYANFKTGYCGKTFPYKR